MRTTLITRTPMRDGKPACQVTGLTSYFAPAWALACLTLTVLTAGIGLIAGMGIASTPAHAERGVEWDAGGLFHQFDAKAKPNKARKLKHKRTRSRARTKAKRSRVAALNTSHTPTRTKTTISAKKIHTHKSAKSGRVIWHASSKCLNRRIRNAIYYVAAHYGRVRVNSTCRSRKRNRRVGGARRSKHLSGDAADIRVWGRVRGAARYLRSVAGGYKHYGGGLFHIDTGPRRTW